LYSAHLYFATHRAQGRTKVGKARIATTTTPQHQHLTHLFLVRFSHSKPRAAVVDVAVAAAVHDDDVVAVALHPAVAETHEHAGVAAATKGASRSRTHY